MKKLFLLVCVTLFLQNLVCAEEKEIRLTIRQGDQGKECPITRSITIKVSGFYDTETGKATLYFHQPIGKATVSLTTETGSAVFAQTIDTDTEEALELALPEQNGVYMLSIVSDTYEGVGRMVL